ncbi:SENESCENCE-RELATED GENE 1, senescence-related gene 1 [Hibiscus trionum]|uniref:SENESCENCE-RELATED GENE 1, senescence-related gene 1 n=1 Tax=Hibiscus trionum TaxID=183268 RepID=A0A9W7ICI7_HIBTR|nr:SENESCENCE-RELATED GENE 1, senescence-related gene 1 [Hibiscus trionum]
MAAISNAEDQVSFSSSNNFSVQELVKQPIKTIPQHYVRLDHRQPVRSAPYGGRPSQMLPVIDMNQLVSGKDFDVELEKLHSTCKDWGFFQLVNHGVNSSILEKVKQEVEKFYELPLEEKMKYKIREGEAEGEGYGTMERDGGKFDWADRFFMTINPIHRRKPHLFPELPSSFRNALETYILEMQNLGKKLLCLMAKALKIDEKEMMEYFDDGMQSLRMTYYPPCPQPELVMGITPHSDSSLITIVHQLNGVDGLYVYKDGVWFPVSFLPNALVVNVGDNLEIFSNGVYRSIEHKVVPNAEKERLSVGFFINPKFDVGVGPSRSLISPQNPPLFKRVSLEQYVKGFFSQKLNVKSYLQHMRIHDNGEDNSA